MHSGHRVNALIMELVIALLFFSVASITIMGVFSATGALSGKSTAESEAMYYAEDLAERLSVTDDMNALLETEGLDEGRAFGKAVCTASVALEDDGVETAYITVAYENKTVITLPVSRITGGEG